MSKMRRMRKVFINFWIFIHISTLLMLTCGTFMDYTDNTEFVQQRAGYDIKLQCSLKGIVDEHKFNDVKVHWYFKQCAESTKQYPHNCNDFQEDEWTQLPCEEHFCNPDLLLRNVTEKYSGLYKCTIHPQRKDASFDIQLVRTYQLEVKNMSLSVPEFLDSDPTNKTAVVGAQVVFQCRIHSEVHPTIKWFRRITEQSGSMEYAYGTDNFNAHILHYNGRTYELLASAREKHLRDEIYLSKLILNGVSLQDEGFYACVAISYRGHKIREAYLHVQLNADEEYWADYENSEEGRTDPREFWLLFLIPLGLAMVPLSFWLCYISLRRCQVRDAPIKHGNQRCCDEELAANRCMLQR